MPPIDELSGLDLYSDLHCHPANIPFHRLRNTNKDPEYKPDTTEYSIWNISRKEWKRRKKYYKKGWNGVMLSNVPQCDFYSLSQGKVRLVFASIYPMERGFFQGSGKLNSKLIKQGLKMIQNKFTRVIAVTLLSQVGPLAQILQILLNSRSFARDLAHQLMMKFHDRRIDFIQGQQKDPAGRYYDYYHELKLEYEFYKKGEGVSGKKDEDEQPVNTFVIANNGTEVRKKILEGSETVTVLTLEGMHAITQVDDRNNKPTCLSIVPWEELEKRLDQLKAWNLFFVTLSHHFDNGVSGHARSLPNILQEITDQSPGRNAGITDMGGKSIRKLLGIEEFKDEKRRVLIDVKHMSAQARIEYYEMVRKYNSENVDDPIPVIASHVGYADTDTLAELAQRANLERDEFPENEKFNAWGINVCDEDIQIIVETGGLIGLSFDQRIMGVSNEEPKDPTTWASVVANNIFAMVYAAKRKVSNKPQNIWKCLAYGTDFDGYINPLNPFPTCREFGAFASYMLHFLESLPDGAKKDLFLDGSEGCFSPAEVVEKLNYKNSLEFTIKHFK